MQNLIVVMETCGFDEDNKDQDKDNKVEDNNFLSPPPLRSSFISLHLTLPDWLSCLHQLRPKSLFFECDTEMCGVN